MKGRRIIVWTLCAVLLMSCGTKKKAVTPQPEIPTWHTCLIQGARATVQTGSEQYNASVNLQVVRDSMAVISIMPFLGIEMMRLEATPMELIGIDKMNGRYAQASYAELNRLLTPAINWDVLQQLCAAELPTGKERARLQYRLGDEIIELIVDYNEPKFDVPVRMNRQRLDKYTQIDITKWL